MFILCHYPNSFSFNLKAVASTAGLTLANALDAMKMALAYGLS